MILKKSFNSMDIYRNSIERLPFLLQRFHLQPPSNNGVVLAIQSYYLKGYE